MEIEFTRTNGTRQTGFVRASLEDRYLVWWHEDGQIVTKEVRKDDAILRPSKQLLDNNYFFVI